MKKNLFNKPSVVFTKKLATTDAYLYGTTWDEEHMNEMVPLSVVPVTLEEPYTRWVSPELVNNRGCPKFCVNSIS